jgi:quercetin dioxygenase-like cupin family protein
MKKVSLTQVKPYEAPGHFDVSVLRLSGKDETGAEKFWVGLSHFLPGGGAEFGATPAEKYYFVLDGEITVKTEKEEITLGPWDSVYIAPNEGRSILNKTTKPVSMRVVVHY